VYTVSNGLAAVTGDLLERLLQNAASFQVKDKLYSVITVNIMDVLI